jgi:hypothetical protein
MPATSLVPCCSSRTNTVRGSQACSMIIFASHAILCSVVVMLEFGTVSTTVNAAVLADRENVADHSISMEMLLEVPAC